jgi:hypothetical protein
LYKTKFHLIFRCIKYKSISEVPIVPKPKFYQIEQGMKGFTEQEIAAALFSKRLKVPEVHLTDKVLKKDRESNDKSKFFDEKRSVHNEERYFRDSTHFDHVGLSISGNRSERTSRDRPSYSPYRGNSDFDHIDSQKKKMQFVLKPDSREKEYAPNKSSSRRSRSRSRSLDSRSRSESRERYRKKERLTNDILTKLPPPPDPRFIMHDDRDEFRRPSRRLENSPKRPRSKSPNSYVIADESTKWIHDRHSLDEPG